MNPKPPPKKAAPTLSPIPSESEDEDDVVYIGWGELKKLR